MKRLLQLSNAVGKRALGSEVAVSELEESVAQLGLGLLLQIFDGFTTGVAELAGSVSEGAGVAVFTWSLQVELAERRLEQLGIARRLLLDHHNRRRPRRSALTEDGAVLGARGRSGHGGGSG